MDNKTLLSQTEIDALIEFLQESSVAPSGKVLDQRSIDKLIELVKFNNSRGIFFSGKDDADARVAAAPIVDPESENELNREDCLLEFEISPNGFAQVYCFNSKTDRKFRISPTCLVENRFVSDDVEWGYAIAPKPFNRVAGLFGIGYSSKTYSEVCRNFAKVQYGDPDAEIAELYLPPEDETQMIK